MAQLNLVMYVLLYTPSKIYLYLSFRSRMKKLLFVFLLLPILCTAQYAEISANVGLIPSSRPAVTPNPASYLKVSDMRSTLNGYLSARVSMNIRHIQFGIGADIFGIQFSQTAKLFYFVNGNITEQAIASNAIVARPAVCPNGFINYKWYLPGSYIYAGLTFGEILNLNQKTMVTRYPAEIIYPACTGWYYGGQVGYSIVIGMRTRINIECGVRYTDATLEKDNSLLETGITRWSRLSFPTSIGLRYRFTRG